MIWVKIGQALIFWHRKQDIQKQERLMEECFSTILNIIVLYSELAILLTMDLILPSVLSVAFCT